MSRRDEALFAGLGYLGSATWARPCGGRAGRVARGNSRGRQPGADWLWGQRVRSPPACTGARPYPALAQPCRSASAVLRKWSKNKSLCIQNASDGSKSGSSEIESIIDLGIILFGIDAYRRQRPPLVHGPRAGLCADGLRRRSARAADSWNQVGGAVIDADDAAALPLPSRSTAKRRPAETSMFSESVSATQGYRTPPTWR